MSRNRKSKVISFSKRCKKTVNGYSLNQNGKPLLDHRIYRKYEGREIGRYRPTPHNISDI